jgi:chromosome segregation ATPase
VPWKKQRTPTRGYQDDGRGRDDKINNSGVVNPKSILLTPKAQADSIDVFSTDSAPDALGSNESQNVQLSNLSDRVRMPGKSQAFKKEFLEKTVWLDRGKEKEYKDGIRALKEELEEEIALNKELTHKVFELKRDTETAHEVHTKAEENMSLTVEGLAFELESEKNERAMTIQAHSLVMQSLQSQMLWHKSKIEDDTKALQVSQIEVSNEAENETTEELRRINKDLLKKQKAIERELASCAKDNDNLRGCLLSHASDASAKEQTLSSALSQLKSLSENYYQVTQSLEYEKNARADEVTSLQWSLDDVSRQMVLLSKAVNELQSENHLLRSDMKRQSLERQRSLLFHRGARGG